MEKKKSLRKMVVASLAFTKKRNADISGHLELRKVKAVVLTSMVVQLIPLHLVLTPVCTHFLTPYNPFSIEHSDFSRI